MIGPLQAIRDQCDAISDSIRWACVLEATAPKAGNVFPGRSFADLNYLHFVQAAEITSQWLTQFDLPPGQRIVQCVRRCRDVTGTNVNLGIVLLIAPLAESNHTRQNIGDVLSSLTGTDGSLIFEAIRIAGAGGLGRVDAMDVRKSHEDEDIDEIDIVAAMRLAANHDRIAKQYAGDFLDLLENVVPLVREATEQRGDVLSGIADAHLQMLASGPDSLIVRKSGLQVAEQVQQRASEIDPSDLVSRSKFDQWLRQGGDQRSEQLGGLGRDTQNRPLNPGTTADLIAAALFILLNPDT